MKKKRGKKPSVVQLPVLVQEDVEKALRGSGGLINYAAKELNFPVEELKKQIARSRYLRNLLIELREYATDIAEQTLMWRIMEKKDLIATMFYLKCQGKDRGWVDRPDKAGDTANKPIYIRILPVDADGNIAKKAGRPKKNFAEIKIGETQKAISGAVLPEKAEDIIDAEVLDD